MTRSYYRSTACALLLYDITRPETFEHVNNWLHECRISGNEAMTIILIGNKSDLEHKRAVTYEQGYEFAQANGLTFFETSAKKSINVDKIFNHSASTVLDKVKKGVIDVENDMHGVRSVNYKHVNQRLSKLPKEDDVESSCNC